jgi:ribosome maturation factor RimP
MNISHEAMQVLVEPIVESMGLKLWGLETPDQGNSSTLRVYIDRDGGVRVEDCERVSRQLGAVLDVEDFIPGEYTLEVSSPGLDRQLYSLVQYDNHIGDTIDVKLNRPFEGRRRFKGTLAGIQGGEIVLIADAHEFLFPFESIEKARVVPQF